MHLSTACSLSLCVCRDDGPVADVDRWSPGTRRSAISFNSNTR